MHSIDSSILRHGFGADSAIGKNSIHQRQPGSEGVLVDDEFAILQDAAEEISMHVAERVEKKHTDERSKKLTQSSQSLSSEAIEGYLDATLGGDDRKRLLELSKQMLLGQGNPLALARQQFNNPTLQFMALQYALTTGEKEGAAKDVLESLREALDELELVHGARIRADINTIDAAREGTAANPKEVAHFQTTYSDMVLGKTTLNATLTLVLERFGENRLAEGLGRLQLALGQDLAAANPSVEPVRLQNLVQDLYQLGVAVTVLDGCRELLAVHGSKEPDAAITLLRDLVAVSSEKWVAASRFTALAQKFGATEIAPQINFLTGMKSLLHGMPVQVYQDSEQRFAIFDALQEALDTAIDREEY